MERSGQHALITTVGRRLEGTPDTKMKDASTSISGRIYLLTLATALLLPSWLPKVRAADPSLAVKSGDDGAEVEVFHAPRIIRGTPPRYPTSEKAGGKEGWVGLTMMIDPKGKPYEVTVIDSSGNAAFEQAAIKGADQIVFRPAMRGETPVDGSFTAKVTFWQSQPAKGASHDFVTAYKQLTHAIDTADQAQADAQLSKLQVQNL